MKKYRSIVRIEQVIGGCGSTAVGTIIAAWNPYMTVWVSLDSFPVELQPHVKAGAHFLAMACIGGDESIPEAVLPTNWELAPEPDPNDGLA